MSALLFILALLCFFLGYRFFYGPKTKTSSFSAIATGSKEPISMHQLPIQKYPFAFRHKCSNTSSNLEALLASINDPSCVQVRLFATETTATAHFSDADGPENNLPLVAALAIYKLAGEHEVHIVHDGLFLTAARLPRYYEVRQLLDAAENNQKVVFCFQRAPFTSAMSPVEAAAALLELQLVNELTTATRSSYFSMLSNVTEIELQGH